MRVTTAFKRLCRLDGVNVSSVEFLATMVEVTVALRRRRLVCPHCGYKTRWRHDTRPDDSLLAPHLDLGTWRLELRATLRRLSCPIHGVVVGEVRRELWTSYATSPTIVGRKTSRARGGRCSRTPRPKARSR